MNIALCFSGQPREISAIYPALKRHILKPLSKYNLFVFMHLPSGCVVPSLGIPVSAILQEDETLIDLPDCNRSNHGIVSRPWHDESAYRSFYLQLRSISRSLEMSEAYASANSIEFDWVFRLRYDNLYFGAPIEDLSSLDPSAVYIPTHDNWGGYNDRFAFGSPVCMNSYSKRYDYFTSCQERGISVGPEPLLKWVLEKEGIPVRRTRVSHHLYRYGNLWMAHYISHYGDIEPARPTAYHSIRKFTRFLPKHLVRLWIINCARLPL